MIDTHCHLTDPRLLDQIAAVLDRAQSAGILEMVTIGTDPPDWEAAIALTKKYPNVRCAVGVHPNNCHEVPFERIADLRKYFPSPGTPGEGRGGGSSGPLKSQPPPQPSPGVPGEGIRGRIVAIGEIGLDHYHKDAPRELQIKFFESQLELARKVNFPVVIHSRESVDDCLAVLKNFRRVRAVFHCFTGTAAEAARIWDAGHLTGFTGVVTFRNGRSLLEIAAQAPADRILVETDAPYLTPEPMRKQKINEPAMVIHTATAIAQARGITLEEFDALTTKSAHNFYRWKSP
jgi:TatD DNase family protein